MTSSTPLERREANCWDVLGCGQGPGETRPDGVDRCPVPHAQAFDGVNGGLAGGRICWAVRGALCRQGHTADVPTGALPCATCRFYAQVRREQGLDALLLTATRASPSEPLRVHG